MSTATRLARPVPGKGRGRPQHLTGGPCLQESKNCQPDKKFKPTGEVIIPRVGAYKKHSCLATACQKQTGTNKLEPSLSETLIMISAIFDFLRVNTFCPLGISDDFARASVHLLVLKAASKTFAVAALSRLTSSAERSPGSPFSLSGPQYFSKSEYCPAISV